MIIKTMGIQVDPYWAEVWGYNTEQSRQESLVVSEVDYPDNNKQRLANATSTTAITKNAQLDAVSNCSSTGREGVDGRAASWAVRFDILLNDNVGLMTFTEFLKKEFSEENITFWTKVEHYRKITDENERKSLAKSLYDAHLSVSSSEAVNVDSASRQATESALQDAPADLFDQPQKHIFNLMKHDSYSRFLKSQLYKDSVLAEMEGRPLPFSEDSASLDSREDQKSLKKQSSISSAEEAGEKRRRSLLPWNKNKSEKRLTKVSTDSDLRKNGSLKGNGFNSNIGRPSLDLADLNQMTKEIGNSTQDTQNTTETNQSKEQQKFCRVLLPDGSTTVIYGKASERVQGPLQKLCERRNLLLTALDVYIVGQDKPIDTNNDFSLLGSKEIKLERRIVFRLDLLPIKKSIGVKGRPHRTVGDVVKAAAQRCGVKMDNMVLYIYDNNTVIEQEANVVTIENHRLVLQNSEDFSGFKKKKEWGSGMSRSNSKPPLKRSQKFEKTTSDATLDALFKELFEGNATFNALFDEHGILDPESKKHDFSTMASESHSTLFGFARRNSYSDKDKRRVPNGSSNNNAGVVSRGKRADDDDEKVFELLSRVGRRLDDQRGHLRPQDLELPEFLIKPRQTNAVKQPGHDKSSKSIQSKNRTTEESTGLQRTPLHNSDSSLFESVCENIVENSFKKSQSQESINISHESSVTAHTFNLSPSKIPFMDQSFGDSGTVPLHKEAEEYFSMARNYDENVNFEDSKLMDRTLRDIGMESRPASKSSKKGVFLSGVRLSTPISELRQRLTPSNNSVESPPRRPGSSTSSCSSTSSSAPVPRPRVHHKRRKAQQQQPSTAPLPHTTTSMHTGVYVAQEDEVEITLLPPSSTDSDDSSFYTSDRLPSHPPSTYSTLSKTEIANYPPPPPMPLSPPRYKKHQISPLAKNNSPLSITTSMNSTKIDSSEASTPSPTTHDLIFDSFTSVSLSPSKRRSSKMNGSLQSTRDAQRPVPSQRRTRRVIALEEQETDDVQVSYV